MNHIMTMRPNVMRIKKISLVQFRAGCSIGSGARPELPPKGLSELSPSDDFMLDPQL